MEHIKRAEVLYHGRKVGRVALAEDGKYVFQYNENWLADGFSISPLKMPLNDSIFVENKLDLPLDLLTKIKIKNNLAC